MIYLAEIAMPLQILTREIHGSRRGSRPLLYEFLQELWQLLNENEIDVYVDNISELLLWIAKNHPEVLNDESNILSDISISRLFFRDSWEYINKPIPTEALNTLLNSRICRNLERFCGYINSLEVLIDFPRLFDIRLALGRHNARSLIEEINCLHPDEHNFTSEGITISIKCGELDLNNIVPLSQYISSVFISNASDGDVHWVVKAATKFLSNTTPDMHFRDIMLTDSTMTAAGVVAIAKGIKKTHINLNNIRCQTPYINADIEGVLDNFVDMMEEKFDIYFTAIDVEEEIDVFHY